MMRIKAPLVGPIAGKADRRGSSEADKLAFPSVKWLGAGKKGCIVETGYQRTAYHALYGLHLAASKIVCFPVSL